MSKKRFTWRRRLSAGLSVLLCLSMLPVVAWAAEEDETILVTATEQDDADVLAAAEPDGTDPSQPAEYRLVYDDNDGKLYKEYPDRNRAAYTAQEDCWTGLDQDGDKSFETLQLNGFRFYSNHKCDETNNGMGIMHPALETLSDSVILDIEGENMISYDADGNMAYGGVLSTRNATVTGSGTIRLIATNAEAPRAWKATNGLAVQGNTTIILNAESMSEYAYGIAGNQDLSVEAGSRIEISVTTNDKTPGTAIALSDGFILADDSVVDGAKETFISGVSGASGSTNNWVNNFRLTQKNPENPVIIRDRTEAERTSQEIHYSWADGKLGDKEFDDLSTHGQLTFTANGESKTIEQIRMRSPGLSGLRAGDVVTVSVDPAEGYTLTGWTLVMGDTPFQDYESAEKYSANTTGDLRFVMPNKNIYAVVAHFDMDENARVAVYETVTGLYSNGTCYVGYGKIDQPFTLPAAVETGLLTDATKPQRFLYWYLGDDRDTQYQSGNKITLDRESLHNNSDGELSFRIRAMTETDDSRPYLTMQTEGQGTWKIACIDTSAMHGRNQSIYAIPADAVVSLTPVPDEGYQFKDWQIVEGNVTVADGKFTMPSTNVTVKAVFEADTNYENPITVQTDGNGTASADAVKAASGTKVTLTATPNKGYIFKEWQAVSGNVTIENNQFTMPAGPVTVKAVFEVCLEINEENFPDANFREEMREDLKIYDEDKDGRLSAAEIAKIRIINIPQKGIKDLTGIEYFTSLEKLFCQINELTVLDLSHNTALTFVNCSRNQLTSLNLSKNTAIKAEEIASDGNIYRIALTENGTFDLSTLPGDFDVKKTGSWTGGTVNGTALTVDKDAAFVTYTYDLGRSDKKTALFTLLIAGRERASVPINAANFPDESFRHGIARELDSNRDGQLSMDEIVTVRELNVKRDLAIRPNVDGLEDLTGIEYFTELESLTCTDYQLTSLDLSKNTKLKQLNASGNVYRIQLADDDTFDLSTLPGKFDISKASDWTGGTVNGTKLTAEKGAEVTYTYDCGGGFTANFTLKVRHAGVKIATPVISPAGGTYTAPHTVKVTITCDTPDASIHYYDEDGYKIFYKGPFTLSKSCKIIAWAEDPYGDMEDSDIATAVFNIVEPGHVHEFDEEWKSDITGHWHACSGCAEQNEFAAHAFQWIIDREATRTEIGLKHEECSVCEFVQNEGTVIDKLTSGGSSGGGGGGGGSSTASSYPVSVDDVEHGTITVTPKTASKGDTVTIAVKPDPGYELGDIKVIDQNGKEVQLTDKGNGQYSFTMPASKVEIKADFVAQTADSTFADVPTDAYYYEAVKWAAEKGITGGIGDNLFAPNQSCTRAQIVTFLWRAAGSPEPKSMSHPFADVPSGSYYEKAVLWAVENGITEGMSNTTFSPSTTCTRAQSVAFLYRAAGSPAVSGSAAFTDVPAGVYYSNAAAWAEQNGITGGIGNGQFGPHNDCTRAQIVTFLYRLYGSK